MATIADKIAAALQGEQAELERMRVTHQREERLALDRVQRLRRAEASLQDPKARQAIEVLVELGWLEE